MSKLALLFMLVSGVAFAKDETTLSCDYGPGRSICYSMDAAINSYNWTCRGPACRKIWNNQRYSIENVAYEILNTPTPTWVDLSLGHKAYALASTICGTSRTFSQGDYDVIVPLVNEENNVLRLLRDLQEQAGLNYVRYCYISVR